MQPSPETTLVIILGASEYAKIPKLSNEAFRNSAVGFKEYLLNRDGFSLSDNNLLDLFDNPDGPADQNDSIAAFLQSRIKELKESKVTATDLILYYVGHGTFVDPGNRYFLALRNMKEGSEEISGFPIKTLANTFKENANLLRRYVILDCCFSAAAFESFQSSGPLELAKQKTEEQLPVKGTALLCASGPRDAAKAPKNLKYTMFSGVLLDVLQRGSNELPERFSLVDLGLKTESILQERFTDAAVRPQVLSPDQTVGDVAKLAIFPNLGLGVRALREDLYRLEETVRGLVKGQEVIQIEQSSLNERLNTLAIGAKNAPIHNSSNAQILEVNYFDDALLRKFPWLRSSGLTKDQWDTIPGPVRRGIIAYQNRRWNGRYWLIACALIAGLAWTFAILGLRPELTMLDVILRTMRDVLIVICGLLAILQFASKLSDRMRVLREGVIEGGVAPTDSILESWQNYDLVIEAKDQSWQSIFGLEIANGSFSISHLIYLVTFIGTLLIRFSPLILKTQS